MITFLSYLAVILGLVLVFQLMHVYQLASELKGENTGLANDRDNHSQGIGMLLFVAGFFIFLISLIFIYKDKLLPEAASDVGKEADRLMNFNWVIIFIVFFITEAMLFYFAYKYKKSRKNTKAFYFPHQDKLELIWTIVPSIVLAVIIIYGLSLWGKMTGKPDKDAIVVQIYAKQFDFTARYAGHDNVLGKSDYKLIDDATNPLGLDTNDAKGWDDIIVKGELHVPVNHQIDFKCNSRDVMHGIFMPYFREQINCDPGMTTDIHFIPTITTAQMREKTHDSTFNYMVLCNRVCGVGHYNMQMKIVVDSPEEYYEWLAKQKTFHSGIAAK